MYVHPSQIRSYGELTHRKRDRGGGTKRVNLVPDAAPV